MKTATIAQLRYAYADIPYQVALQKFQIKCAKNKGNTAYQLYLKRLFTI